VSALLTSLILTVAGLAIALVPIEKRKAAAAALIGGSNDESGRVCQPDAQP
jgi:hypothetical protein